jgi:hypothetical protein
MTPRQTPCATPVAERGSGPVDARADVPRGIADEPRHRRQRNRAPEFRAGLAILSDSLVAGGSSSTVTVYDLPRNERMASVNLTLDVRNAIRGLEVWPY